MFRVQGSIRLIRTVLSRDSRPPLYYHPYKGLLYKSLKHPWRESPVCEVCQESYMGAPRRPSQRDPKNILGGETKVFFLDSVLSGSNPNTKPQTPKPPKP